MPPATLQWLFFLAIVLMELTWVDKISPTLMGILWNIINTHIYMLYIYIALYCHMKYVYSFTLYIYYNPTGIYPKGCGPHGVKPTVWRDTINVVYTQHAIMVCINNMTFGLVLKWAIPQISAFGSGTWWLLYNQWMNRGNVFRQTQVVMGHNHHGLEWILGLDSLGVHRVWYSQQFDGQY